MKQQIITIIGGSGFVGSYVVKELAKTGASIIIASRDPERALPSKTSGNTGQISLIQANLRDEASVERAVRNADVVINLVGLLYESGKQNFTTIHAKAAESLAKSAKKAGAKKFIHMSALGVNKPSQSKYARTKLTGEKAVLEAFPEATIIRPSVIFGAEDTFFNRFAQIACVSPVIPVIGEKTKFQPVYVADVAKAFAKVAQNDTAAGHIYELGGSCVYSFKELMELMLSVMHSKRVLMPIPFPLASLQAAVLELLPNPLLTRDQVRLLREDNIVSNDSLSFKELDIIPTELESILPSYLSRYNSRLYTKCV